MLALSTALVDFEKLFAEGNLQAKGVRACWNPTIEEPYDFHDST